MFEVDLKPLSPAEHLRTLFDIQQTLASFPGRITSVNTFLAERIDESISGVTAPVVINVFGPNLDVIDSKAAEIAQLVGQIPGAIGVRVESSQHVPQLTMRLKPEQLTRWGFTPVDVLEAIQTAHEGVAASQVCVGNQVYDVNVSLAPAAHRDLAEIGSLLLRSPAGVTVPLRQLADISQTTSRYQILHSDGQRLQTVTSAVRGRSVRTSSTKPSSASTTKSPCPKAPICCLPARNRRARSQQDLLIYSVAANAGIVLLLFLALKSVRALLLVLVNLPFAWSAGC